MNATVERHQIHSTLRRMGTGVGAAAPMNVNASSGKVNLVAVGKESIMHAELDASVKMPGFADVMLRQITLVVKSLPNGKVVLESGGEGVGWYPRGPGRPGRAVQRWFAGAGESRSKGRWRAIACGSRRSDFLNSDRQSSHFRICAFRRVE